LSKSWCKDSALAIWVIEVKPLEVVPAGCPLGAKLSLFGFSRGRAPVVPTLRNDGERWEAHGVGPAGTAFVPALMGTPWLG